MAQYRLNDKTIGQPGNRYEIEMIANKNGNIVTGQNPFPVTISGGEGSSATSTSAFGELISVPITPVMQLDGLYGIKSREFEVITSGTGNVVIANAVITVSSGTASGNYGVIRSHKQIRYQPGQGALARFTAGFSTPDANTTQRAGFFSEEQALMVGYNGTQFGVLRQNGGKAEIYQFQITAAATSSANVSLTLDNTSYAIPVTLGDSTTTIATNIAASTAFSGTWLVEQVGANVRFARKLTGATTGTYSFTANGTGVTATITQLQVGTADTNNWTTQANFNIDTLDGSGNDMNPSGMLLDPSHMNVYQINYRWLGVGTIRYAIEDHTTGNMIFFHHEHYTNRYTVPHLDNPSMKVGYVAANIKAGASSNVSTYGASILGAVEGIVNVNRYPLSISSGRKTALTTGAYHHLLSIKNSLIHNNKFNLRVTRLKRVSVAFDGNDPLELYVVLNGTPAAALSWTAISNVESSVNYSTTTTTFNVANEIPVATFIVPTKSGMEFDLDTLGIDLSSTDRISFVVASNQQIASIICAAVWSEE